MDKKYELLKDDYINYRGEILYRIRALKDFGDVKAGDIGGYVESEKNLNHDGSCWVYDNAKVYDNAEVCGYARVFGSAEVYDNARVFGSARVFEDAMVYDDAVISEGVIIGNVSIPFKDVFQYQCVYKMLTAILTEDDEILYSIGCKQNITKEEFIYRIYNTDGGLERNPYRKEYLRLIKIIEIYFKGE